MTRSKLAMAVLYMVIAMTLIPIGDAIAKQLSAVSDHSAGFLAWSRFLVGACFVIPLAWRQHVPNTFTSSFIKKQCVRGVLIGMTILLIIRAVSLSPIADVFGVFFIGPAFSVVLSVFWLREHATKLEWLSVFLGFIGVLLVVQPGGDISEGLPWAFAAGLFYGSFLTATRWAAGSGPPMVQLASQLVVGGLVLLPFAIVDIFKLDTSVLPLVLLMGITSTFANLLSIIALSRARPAYLAPIVYLQVVVATIIGLFFFAEPLNTLAACGIALIVFTGVLKIRLPGR